MLRPAPISVAMPDKTMAQRCNIARCPGNSSVGSGDAAGCEVLSFFSFFSTFSFLSLFSFFSFLSFTDDSQAR